MLKSRVVLDRDYAVAAVDERLFGGFAEHLGRCVYGGMYEPDHPTADAQGFRRDVLALVRELNMPVMRYPGGNFVSGYNWEDGVGPRERRPRRLDLAWKSTETNEFGTNEFVDWCRRANSAPMLAVNLGTRGPEEARQLVEYCNHPGGTRWSDLRREHGYAEPHGVKVWCLGNEMDGQWQMGYKTATEYGRIAQEAAKLMKWVDPSIELVVCGSCGRSMPTFGKWELEVLQHTYDHVDYVSIHTYFGNGDKDLPNFLGKPESMSDFIAEVVALCDAVAATRRSRRRMMLSFDEWNVWYHSHGDRQKRKIADWAVAPPILEDVYTMADALCAGGMLIALLNHADRVRLGCIAQVVNVIAPIMTAAGGAAWRQTIFHPFAQASNFGRGTVLRPVMDGPTYDTKDRKAVPYLSLAAVTGGTAGGLTLFALNRSLDQTMEIKLDLRAFPALELADWQVLRHRDFDAVNTAATPDKVSPESASGARVRPEQVTAVLEPASWNVLRLAPRRVRGR